ncbi:thiamine phosphate synthase [Pseudaeromonas paramecii]|uniref:Thiamine-phosphate synthase n=1 Tax=Pseudaeromonas paramecii TaxID=2138166 RepID=A0ABP8PT40_9GAMM
MSRPIVWSLAGSDCGGGAGLQADLLTIQDLGGHGCTLVTAITAQNSVAVTAVAPVSLALLEAQRTALAEDLWPAAIKVGLLASDEQLAWLSDWLAELAPGQRPPVIYDPVQVASTGQVMGRLVQSDGWDRLLPQLTLITPNLPELAALTGLPVDTPEQIERAAAELQSRGAAAVLVKGGHGAGPICLDYLLTSSQSLWLAAPRLTTRHGHGTGCSDASAIATLLARGDALVDAVTLARAYLQQGLAAAEGVGQGPGPLARLGVPHGRQHLPLVFASAAAALAPASEPFAPCPARLGLYPVVDSLAWIERLLQWGVRTLQLRIKDPHDPTLEEQIIRAIALGRQYGARLFINDYWQLAIRHGAYGVHLGQEDLEIADLAVIRRAGLRLGVSTHGHGELARALALRPSYIALGHIFPTQTKQMPSAPQGLKRLAEAVQLLEGYPAVAIGGISIERVAGVLSTGVASVALVSAITQAADPQAVTRALLAQVGAGGEAEVSNVVC